MKEYDDTKYFLVRNELNTFQKWFNWVVELLWQLTLPLVCMFVLLWSLFQVLMMFKQLIV